MFKYWDLVVKFLFAYSTLKEYIDLKVTQMLDGLVDDTKRLQKR